MHARGSGSPSQPVPNWSACWSTKAALRCAAAPRRCRRRIRTPPRDLGAAHVQNIDPERRLAVPGGAVDAASAPLSSSSSRTRAATPPTKRAAISRVARARGGACGTRARRRRRARTRARRASAPPPPVSYSAAKAPTLLARRVRTGSARVERGRDATEARRDDGHAERERRHHEPELSTTPHGRVRKTATSPRRTRAQQRRQASFADRERARRDARARVGAQGRRLSAVRGADDPQVEGRRRRGRPARRPQTRKSTSRALYARARPKREQHECAREPDLRARRARPRAHARRPPDLDETVANVEREAVRSEPDVAHGGSSALCRRRARSQPWPRAAVAAHITCASAALAGAGARGSSRGTPSPPRAPGNARRRGSTALCTVHRRACARRACAARRAR